MLASVAMLAPFGLTMGTFFPLGLRLIGAARPDYVPWAWAINGCFSVTGTTGAVMIASSLGFQTLFGVALGIYALGTLAMFDVARRRGRAI